MKNPFRKKKSRRRSPQQPTSVLLHKVPVSIEGMTSEERSEHFRKLAEIVVARFAHLQDPTEK